MKRPPKIVFHAGTLKHNAGVTFATLRKRDAIHWAEDRPGTRVHTIHHTCSNPASEDDIRSAAASLGLTDDDFASISPYDNDPDYSPFDWLYDVRVRDVIQRAGHDCAVGNDFMFNEDVPVMVLWIPGTFKIVERSDEGTSLLRSYLKLLTSRR